MKLELKTHLYHSIVSKTAVFVLLVAQGIFLTRLLGPVGKGVQAKLQANASFLVLFLEFALTTGITFFISSQKLSLPKASALSLVAFLQAHIMLAVLLFAVWFVPSFDFVFPTGYKDTFLLWYLVLSFTAGYLRFLYSAMLNGKLRFIGVNRIEFLAALMRVAVFAGLFFSHPGDVSLPFLLGLDLALTVFLSMGLMILFHWQFPWELDFHLSFENEVRPLIQYIGLYYMGAMVAFLYSRVDIWIVEYFAGVKNLGFYAVAVGLSQILNLIPTTVGSVLYPHLSSAVAKDREDVFAYWSRICFSGTFFAALFLAIAASFLIPLLYGEQFRESIKPVQILVWGFWLMSAKQLFGVYNQISGRMWIKFVSELIALFFCVALNWFLLPSLGVLGACWAMLIGNLAALLYVVAFQLHHSSRPVHDYFLFKSSDWRQMRPSP